VLTQELVLLAIVAVTSLLLLHYSTKTSFVTVKCWLTNRKDLSARRAAVVQQPQVPRSFPESQSAILAGSACAGFAGLLLNGKQSSETLRENIVNRGVPSSPFNMRVLAAVLLLLSGT
jgi:hypothetical protein